MFARCRPLPVQPQTIHKRCIEVIECHRSICSIPNQMAWVLPLSWSSWFDSSQSPVYVLIMAHPNGSLTVSFPFIFLCSGCRAPAGFLSLFLFNPPPPSPYPFDYSLFAININCTLCVWNYSRCRYDALEVRCRKSGTQISPSRQSYHLFICILFI